ncbi:MAG: DUF502 domain-containing protein [Dehalococcoidales bacterium]|nr:DUF502 domain-containing protein [Dehalococcoidales bacterium]
MVEKRATSVWRRFLRKFRAILIAGLAVTVPIGLTIWIFVWLFTEIDKLLQPVIKTIFGHEIIGVGFGVIVVLVLIVGTIATNVIGKRIVRWGESLLEKVPMTRTIYVAIKQIAQSFSDPKKPRFMQVVLIEFPVKGMKTIAFITNEEKDKSGRKFFNVFIPTALNPTGGFVEIVREEDIIRTNLSVEEGLKMAISAGSMSPQGLGDSLMVADSQGTSREQKNQ